MRLVQLFASAEPTKQKEILFLSWLFLPILTLILKAELGSGV